MACLHEKLGSDGTLHIGDLRGDSKGTRSRRPGDIPSLSSWLLGGFLNSFRALFRISLCLETLPSCLSMCLAISMQYLRSGIGEP